MRQKTQKPPLQGPIPVAEYVRMSTDDQEYSIDNQRVAIRKYAAEHGYCVTASYADPGKSGVQLKGRAGLAQLFNDVIGGRAQFKLILVYDVSHWGRFQDLDEAAHYEFLCKSHGIPIHYCAEQFPQDGGFSTVIMKTLKRSMAAEYSRELGVKVSAGMVNLAAKGYWLGSTPGFGLRRMAVSSDGQKRVMLQDGEQKAVKTDHTTLVPGPKREVALIRRIFMMALDKRNSPRRIAQCLNQMQMWPWKNGGDVRRWRSDTILNILNNPKYMGCYLYAKTSKKLHAPSKQNPIHDRILTRGAFVPLVAQKYFTRSRKTFVVATRKSSKVMNIIFDI